MYDGNFLLLRRSGRESFLPNVWGIPAGQVQRGEDPSEACLRELLEEAGLRGEVIDLIGYSTFTSKRGTVELNNLQLNFLVDASAGDVELNGNSHSDFRWDPGVPDLLGEIGHEPQLIRTVVNSWNIKRLEKRQLRCHEVEAASHAHRISRSYDNTRS